MSQKTTYKERPILFKGEMVRAILAGTKTQTRRIVKPQDIDVSDGVPFLLPYASGVPEPVQVVCPQGNPGDRLWVKETHAYFDADRENAGVVYRESDNGRTWEAEDEGWKWKPSLFMPRKWSRITLEVVSVRVERLNDISEEDAKAEGAEELSLESQESINDTRYGPGLTDNGYYPEVSYVEGYQSLWESINGHGSWAANPFVWVIEFRRVKDRSVNPSERSEEDCSVEPDGVITGTPK